MERRIGKKVASLFPPMVNKGEKRVTVIFQVLKKKKKEDKIRSENEGK